MCIQATPLTLPAGQEGAVTEEYTDRRVSKVRYLSHRGDTLARRLNTRLSQALDLDLNGEPVPAENYQLMNYGIGMFHRILLSTLQENVCI